MDGEGRPSTPMPRLRCDSITDDDPWIANKRFDQGKLAGGEGGDKGGGRALAVLSPRFLKRTKRSESTSGPSHERDKVISSEATDKERGRERRAEGNTKKGGNSSDDLASIVGQPKHAEVPKSPRGRARGKLLRSFSQTALVDTHNKAELMLKRLKKSGEVTLLPQTSPRQGGPDKHSPRYHSLSQQEKREFEEKIKGGNIQFFRNAYSKKSKKGGPIVYRNVLEGADQLQWAAEEDDVDNNDSHGTTEEDEGDDTSEEEVKATAAKRDWAKGETGEGGVGVKKRQLPPIQLERRGSESSDQGSSDYDEAEAPKSSKGKASPQVQPLMSPRQTYLTPEQLKEMVRERKQEIKREKEREKREKEEREREEKERAKREEKERKEREKEKEKERKRLVKRNKGKAEHNDHASVEDQPFPGISLANDKVKSLLERDSATTPDPEGQSTTPRRPSQAEDPSLGSPRVPPSLTLSAGGMPLLRSAGSSPVSPSSPPPASPRSPSPRHRDAMASLASPPSSAKKVGVVEDTGVTATATATATTTNSISSSNSRKEDQEKREKQLKLEAERRKKYKKQISIHLGLSKQQRRSRSFSDLTHYFVDQPDEAAKTTRKKEKKKEKKEKKENKKKDKKDKPAHKDKDVQQSLATEAAAAASVDEKANADADKEPPKNEAKLSAPAAPVPRITIATGQDREQELREIREMLSARKKKTDDPAQQDPQDRKPDKKSKKTLYRSNSEQHLKLLTAKIPSMLLQEKISSGKGLKSQIVLSRPERELIDRQVDLVAKMEDMNRGKNGSRARKPGVKPAKDRLRVNVGEGENEDEDENENDQDNKNEDEDEDEENENEAKGDRSGQEEHVFVQVKGGQVFGVSLDELMRLQRSSASPPTSPQPSPSLTSPLSGSPMSCSPPASPLGMASSSSVPTSAVHFTLSKHEAKLPVVLSALTNAILEFGGTQMTGLFRVPGKKATMDIIRDRLNSGIYQFEEGTCPHDLASLMKEWLKSITPPLIPLELYDRCVEVSGRPTECVEVIEKSIPELNKHIIKYVVRFLQQQILSPEVQRATRMDIRSIATAFAPCFLDNPTLSMEELVKNIQAHIKFMVNLLMLLNVNVGKISSNAVPVRKLKDKEVGGDATAPPNNEESPESGPQKEPSEGSRIIPKAVNERFKRWQERSKTKGSASARVRGERKRSVEKKE